ncbi:hypothetical protein OG913_27615 [Microbispora hainanensis]|uniref:Uncharacterized protein n=1 Tax=Microbispora hainanensis TaxID=568844 RepID=A0ABZ1SJM0_9ACTN|nr:hypothetical protein [Microbispora hainanensis]
MLSGAQGGERVAAVDLAELDVAARAAGAERVDEGAEFVRGMTEHAQPQGLTRAQTGRLGAGEPRLDQVEGLLEVLPEAPAHRGQGHPPAGAIEQGHAEAPFLLADGLADAGLGHAEPFRRAAEVQLLRQREEDLDVAQLH